MVVGAEAGGGDAPTIGPDSLARGLREAAGRRPLSLEATGTSMGRTILAGERVQVVPAGVPRWGEVWAFCDDRAAVVLHRCRRRRPAGYVFQGDACCRADPPVPASRLIGRVEAVERGGTLCRLGHRDRWVRGLSREVRQGGRRIALALLRVLRLR